MVWEWGRADGGEGEVEVSEVPRVCEGASGDGVVEGGSGAEGVGGAELRRCTSRPCIVAGQMRLLIVVR